MAALDRMTGETVWTCKGGDDRPGYASPILADCDGLQQIVTVMSESVVGVRAADGKLLWRYPHKVYADEKHHDTALPRRLRDRLRMRP